MTVETSEKTQTPSSDLRAGSEEIAVDLGLIAQIFEACERERESRRVTELAVILTRLKLTGVPNVTETMISETVPRLVRKLLNKQNG